MKGSVKRLVDELVQLRSGGNPAVVPFVRAHLVLSGVDPDLFTETTEDDASKVEIVQRMLREFKRR